MTYARMISRRDTRRFRRTIRYSVVVASVIVTSCGWNLASVSAASAAAPQRLVIYSVAEQEQFVNNADDRARGEGHNPFGHYNDLQSSTAEPKSGPFPGDEAVFSFNLYAKPSLGKKVGAAVLTCEYNFNGNAFCDAAYTLSGGTLIASGAFNFNAGDFALSVSGGYEKYGGDIGVLSASPAANHTQRLVFDLK